MNPKLVRWLLDGNLLRLRRVVARATGAVAPGLTVTWQADEAHSHLAVSVATRIVAATHIEVRLLVLPPAPDALTPERSRRSAWSIEDAARTASAFGLEFPTPSADPSRQARERAASALASNPTLEAATQIGTQLWSGADLVEAPDQSTLLARNARTVSHLGHFAGGMIHYAGEWFWGADRAPLLIERLRRDGFDLEPTLVELRGAPSPLDAGDADVLELFFSFRSPYSYLALRRSVELCRRHDIELRIRPVLPMVMRGLAVPRPKRLAIVLDSKLVADSLDIPFGFIADPVGPGVERCLAVFEYLRRAGADVVPFTVAAADAIWAKGIDVATDAGLGAVTAEAGLDSDVVAHALADEGWREAVDANRDALLDMGLWGVPSFRLGEVVLWGQDRLPWIDALLEAR